MWNWSENQVEMVWIRHGATRSNKEYRYLGKTDEGLSEEGMEELKRAKERNCYPKVDYVFCSPMKRCLETAEILYPAKEVVVIPDWEEMDFGVFEGKNYIDLQGEEYYQVWIDSNAVLPFPGGEGREEFIDRCKEGFYKMLDYLFLWMIKGQNLKIQIGLIVHGGTIMSLFSSFSDGEYFDYSVANGGGYFCVLKGNRERTEFAGVRKLC